MNEEQKQRLLAETRETAERLNKLNSFMATDAFLKLPREDKDLLYSQQRVMSEYVQILGARIRLSGMRKQRELEYSMKPNAPHQARRDSGVALNAVVGHSEVSE